MVKIQVYWKLREQTLYLGVKLLDHFLEKNSIKNDDELQLVGVVTLRIAAQVEVKNW